MSRLFRIVTPVLLAALLALQPGCSGSAAPPESAAAAPPTPTGEVARPPETGRNDVTVDIDLTADSAPRILLEAETGRLKEPMKIFTDKTAAGKKYVLAPEGPNHKEISFGGDVALAFKVEEAGKYEVWLRVWWDHGCANSLNVVIDGKAHGYITNNNTEVWQWMRSRAGPFALAAGDHLLVVGNREDGSRLDQVLLIQDGEYVPAGIEKPLP